MRVERAIVVASLALLTAVGTLVAGVGPVSQQVRMAQNEAAAIADLRDIVAAAQLYQASNGAWPTNLSCLGVPVTCPAGAVGGFPPGTPPFLDPLRGAVPGMPGVLTGNSFIGHGYVFTYATGASTTSGQFDYGASTFTLNADPVMLGQSGQRYFEIDSTGVICESAFPLPNDGVGVPLGCARL